MLDPFLASHDAVVAGGMVGLWKLSRQMRPKLTQLLRLQQTNYGPRGRVAVFVDNANILGGSYEHEVRIFYDQVPKMLKQQLEHLVQARFYSRAVDLGESHRQFLQSVKAAEYNICEPLPGRPKNGKQHPDVDCCLLTDLLILADQYDTCIVLSGDIDYLPAYRYLMSVGKRVEVWGFTPCTSKEVKAEVDAFVDLRTLHGVCKPRVKKSA